MTNQQFQDKLFRMFYKLANDFREEHKEAEKKGFTPDHITDAVCQAIYRRLARLNERECRKHGTRENQS